MSALLYLAWNGCAELRTHHAQLPAYSSSLLASAAAGDGAVGGGSMPSG